MAVVLALAGIAASPGHGIQPAYAAVELHLADGILDAATLALRQPRQLDLYESGGNTYAIAATREGIQIVNVSAPSWLRANGTLTDSTHLGRLVGVDTFTRGQNIYAIVGGWNGGIDIIDITNHNSLSRVGGINDSDTLLLSDPWEIATFDVGASTYAIVTNYASSEPGIQIINVSTPASPAAISKVSDTADILLDAPYALDIWKSGSRTYAAVASGGTSTSSGIQVVEITDPANPRAAGKLLDNITSGAIPLLEGARSVDIYTQSGRTYAIVAATGGQGIQIVDLTDPENPRARGGLLSSVHPSSAPKTEDHRTLVSPTAIAVTEIGGRMYAAVTTQQAGDAKVVLLDINDPDSPVVATQLKSISALDATADIEIATHAGKVHAIISGRLSNNLQAVELRLVPTPEIVHDHETGRTISSNAFITNPVPAFIITFDAPVSGFNATDIMVGGTAGATAVNSISALDVNGVEWAAHTIGWWSSTLQQEREDVTADTYKITTLATGTGTITIDIPAAVTSPPNANATFTITRYGTSAGADQPLIPVGNIADGGSRELSGASGVATIEIGGHPYAAVAASLDNGFQLINMSNPFNPTATDQVQDTEGGSGLLLEGAHSVATAILPTGPHNTAPSAIVTGYTDDGIQVLTMSNASNIQLGSGVEQQSGTELDGPRGIAITEIGTDKYAVVSGGDDDGITIFHAQGTTFVTRTSSVSNSNTLELDNPHGVAIAKIGTGTYAVVAARDDDGVQIINMTVPASPTTPGRVTDTADLLLDGAQGVAIAQINSRTYALVTSWEDGGLQIIDITNPASPTTPSKVPDTASTYLRGSDGVAVAEINSRTYAIVAGYSDDGVQMIDITDPANPTNAGGISDDTDLKLDNARGVAVLEIDGLHYALVTSPTEHGVQVLGINPYTPVPAITSTSGTEDRKSVV